MEDIPQNVQSREKSCALKLAKTLKGDPWNLMKGEILMILNHRPPNRAVLCTLIEEYEERFTESQLDDLVGIVRDAIGPMEDSGKAERLEEQFRLERTERGAANKTETAVPSSRGAPKKRDGDIVPIGSLTEDKVAQLPIDEAAAVDQAAEEAELWALMEKEARENQEHLEHVEESPLTRYMKGLRMKEK